MKALQHFFRKPYGMLAIYIIACLAVSLQKISLPDRSVESLDVTYSHYNNYVIFVSSFRHLIAEEDLYGTYYDEHWDLFKYLPPFALAMGVFSWIPDPVGAVIWNLLNTLLLWLVLMKVPWPSARAHNLALLFILPELITNLQNFQANALVAAVILGGAALMMNQQRKKGLALLTASAFMKPFTLALAPMSLYYDDRWKNIVTSGVVMILIFAAPFLVADPAYVWQQYSEWLSLTGSDAPALLNVQGILSSFSTDVVPGLPVLIVGIIALALVYWRFHKNRDGWWLVSMILMWVVLFNPKSESPTYIIAVAGVASWYYLATRQSRFEKTLFILVLIFTCLGYTDLFPPSIRNGLIKPWVLKAWPVLIVFVYSLGVGGQGSGVRNDARHGTRDAGH